MNETPTKTTEADWGYLDCGPRGLLDTFWRRVKLWRGIAFREWHAGRIGPVTAWRVCAGIHPWRETVKKWGITNG